MALEIPVAISEHHLFEDVIEDALVFHSQFPAERISWIFSRIFTPVEFAHAKV
jgi:hypothetical protein